MSFDEKMKKDLKKDLEIPEVVEQKIQNAYKEIGQGKVRMKKQDNGKQKSRKVWVAAAVAVIAVSGSGLYANPVLAKNIPVIGNVFAKMQENRAKDLYAGKDKTAYGMIEDNSVNVQNPGAEAEDNGVTVTVSDAYCDGYEMYCTMTAVTDNEQINQKKYLSFENSLRVQVDGEECGVELTLEKAEDGSFVELGHINADWLKKKKFSDQSTVDVQFTKVYGREENELSTTKYEEGKNLLSGEWSLEFTGDKDTSKTQTYEVNAEDNGFKVSKVVKVPASTYLQLEVPEAYENVQMIITDADGNALQKFGGSSTDPENGMYQIKMQFEQTDTDQIHVQVVDMNQSTNEELKVVAEITASLN